MGTHAIVSAHVSIRVLRTRSYERLEELKRRKSSTGEIGFEVDNTIFS